MAKTKYSIFHLEGGLGKHVAATAVAKAIKNNHPDRKLIVVCAYPEIFLNLNFVDRVYRIGNTPYFYQDYIDGKDSLIFKHEPYFSTDHILKKSSLVESWCKTYNVEYKGEMPSLEFNLRQRQYGVNKWKRDRPVMVIQTNGGPLTDQPYPYSWTRDIPYLTAVQLSQYFTHDYHIIQICRNPSNALPGVEVVTEPMSNMELLSLLLISQKQILIDSALQHAAAALGKSSTVLWVATSPKVFGYEMHNNIQATLPTDFKLPDSYFFDYNFNGAIHECPLMDDNIFDVNEIITSVNYSNSVTIPSLSM
jgi:hypothetical protein